MAKKNQRTECSGMAWGQFLTLIESLKKMKEYKFLLFVAMGGYCGIRIGDLLSLKWVQINGIDELLLNEGKTGKYRKIALNASLKEIIQHVFINLKKEHQFDENQFIFKGRNGKPLSRQYVNRILRQLFIKSKIKVQNPSSHTLRKTFGKRVYEINDRSEASLILLSQIFNHSSTSITRKYIGINQETIKDAYMNL